MLEYLFNKTPLSFLVSDLWRDEAFSFVMSNQPIDNLLKATASDFNPPLYYLVLKLWMMFFGYSEIALRSLSLFFYLATIYVIYLLLKNIFKISEFRSFIYLLIVVFNPFLNFYAFEARMYSMSVFLGTLSYYFFFRKNKKLFSLTATLSLFTHYFSIFILFSQALVKFLPYLYRFKTKKSKVSKKFIIKIFSDNREFFVPIIAFLPWCVYLFLVHDFGNDFGFWVIRPLFEDFLMMPFVLFTGYERVLGQYYHEKAGYTTYHWYINLLLLSLVITSIVTAIYNKHFKKRLQNELIKNMVIIFFWAFLTPILSYFASLFLTPTYHPRYFIASAPGFLIFIILTINLLADHIYKFLTRLKKLPIKTNSFIVVLITLLFVSFLNQYQNLNLKYRAKTTVSDTYNEIMSIMKPDDYIYLSNELDYFLALYYARNAKVRIYKKNYEEIPNYVGKVFMPKNIFVNNAPKYPQKAFLVDNKEYSIISEM